MNCVDSTPNKGLHVVFLPPVTGERARQPGNYQYLACSKDGVHIEGKGWNEKWEEHISHTPTFILHTVESTTSLETRPCRDTGTS